MLYVLVGRADISEGPRASCGAGGEKVRMHHSSLYCTGQNKTVGTLCVFEYRHFCAVTSDVGDSKCLLNLSDSSALPSSELSSVFPLRAVSTAARGVRDVRDVWEVWGAWEVRGVRSVREVWGAWGVCEVRGVRGVRGAWGARGA
ncbi:hypothetical protein RR46_07410 [Papilio xuthus]|uniref:Uncharacterized protein n=1 Tax=Papilio xuthus TaxID=66420 RepID=A0A194PXB6_PAPXU|nr:hypothetical protein RR46_07410 [Papilio xuthus]